MFKKCISLSTYLCIHLATQAIGAITTLATPIDTNYTGQAVYDVVSCYNNASNQVIFSWVDANTGGNIKNPYYAICGVSHSASPILTTYANPATYNVFCCYNGQASNVEFSWGSTPQGQTRAKPAYVVGTVSSSSSLVDPTYMLGVEQDVICSYDSSMAQVVFSWATPSGMSTNNPYFSVGEATATRLDTNYQGSVLNDVYSCDNGQATVFSWSSDANVPYYSIDGGVNSATPIDPSYIGGVAYDVFCCYNSAAQQVVFCWAEETTGTPYYSIGGSINSATPIDPSYTGKATHDVFCCYDSALQQVFFSWVDHTTATPYYSIGGGSNSAILIDPSYTGQALHDVFCSYNSQTGQVVFSWANITKTPYYAIYSNPITPPNVLNSRLLRAIHFSDFQIQKGH